jgi:alpha-beta hydrolase superfamily lysophospholipase
VSPMRHPIRSALAALLATGTLLLAPSVGSAGLSTEVDARADRSGKPRAEVVPVGTYAVGRATQTFVDDSRPTDAVGTFAGAPDRTLKTTIYYPAKGTYVEDTIVDGAPPVKKDAPYPLILFSHGLTANATVYEGVINEWVSAGYAVAAPDYPLSSTNAPGGNVFVNGLSDVKNQPADASFVIDEVLALSKEAGTLRGLVDKKQIGASGHSLGGITTYGLTYSTCCIDKRIDAAAPMSGLAGLVADGTTYFRDVDTPLLILHGDSDPLVPYQAGLDAYAKASAPKFFVTLTATGHVTPFVGAEGPSGDVLVASGLAFWDYFLKGDRDGLERLRDSVPDPSVATLQEDAA